MNTCIVCEAILPPGRTRTCTQSCAKVLADRTKQENIFGPRDRLRALYGNCEKQGAREVMESDIRALRRGARVLDLYGGGLSAEWIKSIRPDVELWVAERDRRLWPALKADAKRLGFTPVYGDFALAIGSFDLIFLDLCAEPLGAHRAVAVAVALLWARPKMNFYLATQFKHGDLAAALYVTVLKQNRHGYAEMREEAHEIATRALLDAAAGSSFVSKRLHSYRQAGGRGVAELWRVGPSYVEQSHAIEERRLDHQRDHDYHADAVEMFFMGDGRSGITHARGHCSCLHQGHIAEAEAQEDRRRLEAWGERRRARFECEWLASLAGRKITA